MNNQFITNPNIKILMLKGPPGTTDYNDLENKPTKLSDFANDGIFVTNTTDDLVNYYTKSETSDLLENYCTTSEYTTTLPVASWSSEAPFTQTVSVQGILATDTPIVDIVLDSDTSTAISQISSWAFVSKIETSTNSITATCLESKPEVDLPIQLKVVR